MYNNWDDLKKDCLNCRLCGLCETRTNVVVGVGNPDSKVLFIGEGPGQNEDLQGEPFVGRGGKLLDKMLAAVHLDRNKNIYIANIVKCRPPQNRVPEPDERSACMPYLRQQVALVRPKIIVCLGSTPTRALLGEDMRITRDRGVWQLRKGVWFMPTYHPAALLRDEDKKRPAWKDFQAVRDKLMELGVYPGGEGGA